MFDAVYSHGFFLYVEPYIECVSFYRDVLDLPILFDTDELTCFGFGESYLMIEAFNLERKKKHVYV